MKILVNASNLTVGGGVQVALSFIHFLPKFSQHEFLVVASTKVNAQINKNSFGKNIQVKELNYGMKNWLKRDKSIALIEQKFQPEIVFTVFGPSYWTPQSKHLMGFALPWLINPESKAFSLLPTKDLIKKRIQNSIKAKFTKQNSNHYVVETEDVKNRINKYLGAKLDQTWVVDNTYNQYFNNINPTTLKGDIFELITISANYPHKNLRIIKKVIPILKEKGLKVRFTLTIPQEDFKGVFGQETDYLRNLGPISAKDCPDAYNNANALFLPTLLECFTASYPEAMIMQRPILTSDLGFSRAICKDENAIFFDPLNEKDIALKIEELIKSPTQNQKLINNGLMRVKEYSTSEKRAEQYIEILESIYK